MSETMPPTPLFSLLYILTFSLQPQYLLPYRSNSSYHTGTHLSAVTSTQPPLTPTAAVELQLPHMGNRESKVSKHRFRASRFASNSNLVIRQSDSLQQAALSPPIISRSSRFFNKLGWKSSKSSNSPPPVKRRKISADDHSATPSSQPFAVSASVPLQPHSSYSETSTLQTPEPPLRDLSPLTPGGIVATGGNVTVSGNVSPVTKPLPSLILRVHPSHLSTHLSVHLSFKYRIL